MSIKYILVGGYPHKAPDGGKAFCEELIKDFKEPVKILECLFARTRDNWDLAFNQDKEFFINNLPNKKLEFQMALPEKFREQVKWANAVYIRGGVSEAVLIELQKQNESWKKELSGKTLAGSSAGAQAISKYYYGLDDLKIGEGLGLLQLKVIVHYGSGYNAPNIDWDKAEIELKQHNENLPLIKLAEGQFEIREQ